MIITCSKINYINMLINAAYHRFLFFITLPYICIREDGMQFLKQPYPLNLGIRFKIRIIIFGGLFVLLFFSLFQPFYLSTYSFPTKIIVIGAFVLITVLFLTFNLFIIPGIFKQWFKQKNWKVYKEILWITYNIYTVGVGFFLFKIFYGFYSFTFNRIVTGTLATIAIGFIPASIYVLVRQYFILKGNVQTLAQKRKINLINEKNQFRVYTEEKEISISSERNEKEITLKLNDLLYLESEKNYVNIYLLIEGEQKKIHIRNSMKAMERFFLGYHEVVRCHRAFMVNIFYIKQLLKEGSSYQLILKHTNNTLPVSKTYLAAVMEKLS